MKKRVKNHFWSYAIGIVLDLAALFLALYTSYLLRFYVFPTPAITPFRIYMEAFITMSPVWLLILVYSARLYEDPFITFENCLVRIIKACFLSLFFTIVISFFLNNFLHSRLIWLLFFPLSVLYLSISHYILNYVNNAADNRLRLLVLGCDADSKLAELINSRARNTTCIYMQSVPFEDLPHIVRKNSIDRVLLAGTDYKTSMIPAIADMVHSSGAELFIVPSLFEMTVGQVQIDNSIGLPTIYIHHASFLSSNHIIKRSFDIFFSLIIMLVSIIPFLLIALLIKLNSPGPVLYRQTRVGYKDKDFKIFKFRTMYNNLDEGTIPPDGVKLKDDPRVTLVGKHLRRYSIDEIPQIINVLRGEMSVVGPRPLIRPEHEAYTRVAGHRRMDVLPGLTGLAQINGRGCLDFEEKFSLDLYYVEHWSLGLDLVIILKTIPAIFKSEGAY